LSARATERYHEARERIARSSASRLGARFTRGTTESLNLAAMAWGRANVGAAW
jgi:selenocysteine lyase/cysteine desulfurase